MFSPRRLAIALCLAIMGASAVAVASDWEEVGTTSGVTVHTKDVPDSDASSFRGERTANVHIGDLIAVLTNPDQRPNWVSDYGGHETLERSDTHEIYWLRIDLSWPATDRDFVFRADYSFDEENRVFTAELESVQDSRKGEDDCCVRGTGTTTYTFTAIPGQDMTRVEVESTIDPQGRLPSRIVRRTQREWPVNTLNALVNQASGDVQTDSRVQDWHSTD